jgi:hypothetical protein
MGYAFLMRGLQIVHVSNGFDFLGFNVRLYGKKKEGSASLKKGKNKACCLHYAPTGLSKQILS